MDKKIDLNGHLKTNFPIFCNLYMFCTYLVPPVCVFAVVTNQNLNVGTYFDNKTTIKTKFNVY